jgi:hypothetical protein
VRVERLPKRRRDPPPVARQDDQHQRLAGARGGEPGGLQHAAALPVRVRDRPDALPVPQERGGQPPRVPAPRRLRLRRRLGTCSSRTTAR